MDDLQQILSWFTSGNGRAMAAALLFGVILLVKRVPAAKAWLEKDTGILTRPRKKLLVTGLFAVAPAIALLPDENVPLAEVWKTAAWAFVGAMGLHGGLKAARGQRTALLEVAAELLGDDEEDVEEDDETPDPSVDVEEDDDGEEDDPDPNSSTEEN